MGMSEMGESRCPIILYLFGSQLEQCRHTSEDRQIAINISVVL